MTYAIRVQDATSVLAVMVYIGKDGQPTSDLDNVMTFPTVREARTYLESIQTNPGTAYTITLFP